MIHQRVKQWLPQGVRLWNSGWFREAQKKRSRRRAWIVFSAFAIGAAALYFSLLLPGARGVSLLMAFCLPSLTLQLGGTRRAPVLIVSFLAVSGSLVAAGIPLSTLQLAISLAIWGVQFLVAWAGEIRHEGELGLLVKSILFDDQTGLPKHAALVDGLPAVGRSLFAIIRVDNFSDLSMLAGRELADEILAFVTRGLEAYCLRSACRIFRLRGVDFGLLLPLEEMDEARARELLLEIGEQLQKVPLPSRDLDVYLKVRMGAVTVDPGNRDRFMAQADLALKACISRHDRVVFFSEGLSNRSLGGDSPSLFCTLKRNIIDRSHRAHFQPIVSAGSEKAVWYESLLRIRGDDGTYQSPLPFLPIAESTGFDYALTDFMISEACRVLAETDKDVSVNLSPSSLLRPGFIDLILERYHRIRPRNGRLILEILESSELHEIDACCDFLSRARENGCLVALDDFGSRYTHLAALLRLPMDIVKIDGNLIQKIESDKTARSIVRRVIDFCRLSGISIAAEYVDRPSLADLLKRFRVDYLQGFLYGKPRENVADS